MGKLERTNVVKLAPTISTPQYAALDVIGGSNVLTNAMGIAGGAGILHSITAMDDDNEKPELHILIFDSAPSGTVTDNGAFAHASGDTAKLLGYVNILSTDFVTIVSGSLAIATFRNIGLPVRAVADSADLYVLVLVAGTPTFTATTDLRFVFGFLLD